jgi:hypothetical protein
MITSKGQTTVPGKFRKQWKTTEVIWEGCPDGSARVRPLPNVQAMFGMLASTRRKDPREITKARAAMAARAR